MKRVLLSVMVLGALLLTGCSKVVGPYYLNQEKYAEGIEVLGERLQEHPDDASAAYFIGRYYLGMNKPAQGLQFLDKAVALDSGNADYVFWQGVAHWALADYPQERAAYQKAISLDPNHISANLYLGHSYLDKSKWEQALTRYRKVIQIDPYNPEALFNEGLVLNKLGQSAEAKQSWKKFLEYYPDGSLAIQATQNLNVLGDFTYRNFIIGERNVPLHSINFDEGSVDLKAESKDSLHVLKTMMNTNDKLALHIVTYVKGNKTLAKARSKAVRDYLVNGHPAPSEKRLPLSWFGSSEIITIDGKSQTVDQSVQFITIVK